MPADAPASTSRMAVLFSCSGTNCFVPASLSGCDGSSSLSLCDSVRNVAEAVRENLKPRWLRWTKRCPRIHDRIQPTKIMRRRGFVLLAIIGGACAAAQSLLAVTIPAGATLVVRTHHAVFSQDRIGTSFTASLEHDVTVNGKAVLRAGTQLAGMVTASRPNRRSRPLTLGLTALWISGRAFPIKTDGVEPRVRSAGPVHGVEGTSSVVAVGTKLTFHLAQPLQL